MYLFNIVLLRWAAVEQRIAKQREERIVEVGPIRTNDIGNPIKTNNSAHGFPCAHLGCLTCSPEQERVVKYYGEEVDLNMQHIRICNCWK
jgi:hypothetical protein